MSDVGKTFLVNFSPSPMPDFHVCLLPVSAILFLTMFPTEEISHSRVSSNPKYNFLESNIESLI